MHLRNHLLGDELVRQLPESVLLSIEPPKGENGHAFAHDSFGSESCVESPIHIERTHTHAHSNSNSNSRTLKLKLKLKLMQVLRLLLMSLVTFDTVKLFLFIQLLHGVCFALMWSAAVGACARHVRPHCPLLLRSHRN